MDEPIIMRMMPDPKPLETIGTLSGKCAVVETHPHRVENSNLFEAEGGVPGIRLEKCKVLVGKQPDIGWKLPVEKPEIRVGKVVQSGVQRPAS
jgi:hypothetical protein